MKTVDRHVHDLAALFIGFYQGAAPLADDASDAEANAIADLADDIQQAIEDYLEEAVAAGRLKERG